MYSHFSGEVLWPDGDYALPMSVFGCPDPDTNNWQYGYINITFKLTIDLFETSLGRIGNNETDLNFLELLGPYGPHSIQLNFCTHEKKDYDETGWPSGQYGVHGTHNGCPTGKLI